MTNFSLLSNPTNFSSLEAFIINLVNMAIAFSIIVAVVALIIAGFKYILAMGDEEKIGEATKSLIFALVGLVIVFIAPLVVQYITLVLLTE